MKDDLDELFFRAMCYLAGVATILIIDVFIFNIRV